MSQRWFRMIPSETHTNRSVRLDQNITTQMWGWETNRNKQASMCMRLSKPAVMVNGNHTTHNRTEQTERCVSELDEQ